MPKATVHLHSLVQDSQEYGSNDEYMISRVFFDLEIDGVMHKDLFSNIKQVVGSSFEGNSAIEVSAPVGYKGPFNQGAFQQILSRYFLSLIGSKGSGIHLENCQNIRMHGNRFSVPHVEKFEIEKMSGGW